MALDEIETTNASDPSSIAADLRSPMSDLGMMSPITGEAATATTKTTVLQQHPKGADDDRHTTTTTTAIVAASSIHNDPFCAELQERARARRLRQDETVGDLNKGTAPRSGF